MLEISREEFVAEASNFSEYLDYFKAMEIGFPQFKNHKYGYYYVKTDEEKKQLSNFLSGLIVESIYKGGYTGGNCWNDTEPYYSSSDNKIEFSALDKFLAKVVPDISYLKYKEIKDNLVKEEDYSEGEYYGNTSDYKIFYIDLNALYDYLQAEA
jgi:hypothetical protein